MPLKKKPLDLNSEKTDFKRVASLHLALFKRVHSLLFLRKEAFKGFTVIIGLWTNQLKTQIVLTLKIFFFTGGSVGSANVFLNETGQKQTVPDFFCKVTVASL